jgi:hypothetical protein
MRKLRWIEPELGLQMPQYGISIRVVNKLLSRCKPPWHNSKKSFVPEADQIRFALPYVISNEFKKTDWVKSRVVKQSMIQPSLKGSATLPLSIEAK